MAHALVVLDFDGTVYRDSAPVREYARIVASRLPPGDEERLPMRLDRFLSTGEVEAGWSARRPEDGWDAVSLLATALGAGPADLNEAFALVRSALVAGRFALEVPAGLVDQLRWIRHQARCSVILASNSPVDSVGPVLALLGIEDEFDVVVGGAAKPAGLPSVVHAAGFDAAATPILSVGDHYANDIAPAVAAGFATGYINPFRLPARPATFSAATFEDLYGEMRRWCADPPARNGPAVSAGGPEPLSASAGAGASRRAEIHEFRNV